MQFIDDIRKSNYSEMKILSIAKVIPNLEIIDGCKVYLELFY